MRQGGLGDGEGGGDYQFEFIFLGMEQIIDVGQNTVEVVPKVFLDALIFHRYENKIKHGDSDKDQYYRENIQKQEVPAEIFILHSQDARF
jgi:hypothetical protein